MLASLRNLAFAALLGVVAGLGLGWKLWRAGGALSEPAAVARRQADSSLVLGRAPSDTTAKPAQIIPKGGVVERVVRVVVQPRAVAVPDSAKQNVSHETITRPEVARTSTTEPTIERVTAVTVQPVAPSLAVVARTDSLRCPAVTIDLSLIRMPDRTRRVVASSPDGLVIGGVDVPLEPRPEDAKPLRWSVGPAYTAAKAWGAAVTRDVGPFRAVAIVSEKGQWAAGVAIRF